MSDLQQKLSNIHKSFTIWFNGISASIVAFLPVVKENMADIQSYVPANFFQYFAIIVIVGNILLRFKTNSSLADK